MAHETPGIIGCLWSAEDHRFLHHFLPTIAGHENKEHVDLNTRLQEFFEFAASAWVGFAPSELKDKFPRDFRFPVTVPYTFAGKLPEGLGGTPQLEVQVQSYEKAPPVEAKEVDEEQPGM